MLCLSLIRRICVNVSIIVYSDSLIPRSVYIGYFSQTVQGEELVSTTSTIASDSTAVVIHDPPYMEARGEYLPTHQEPTVVSASNEVNTLAKTTMSVYVCYHHLETTGT